MNLQPGATIAHADHINHRPFAACVQCGGEIFASDFDARFPPEDVSAGWVHAECEEAQALATGDF